MDLWSFWLILAAILIITEVLTLMMWALCFAVGAIAAFICSLCDLPYLWQGVAFVVGALISYIAMLPWIKKRHHKTEKKECRTGMDALLGRKAFITHEIRPGKTGRARIDGDNWQVIAPHVERVITDGEEVVVTAYDSIILTVDPVSEK